MLYMQIYIPCKELQMLKRLYFPARYMKSMSAKMYISSNIQKNIFSQVHGEQGPNSVHQNLWGGSGAGAQGGQADHVDGDGDEANYLTQNFYFGQPFFSIIPLLFQGNFAFLCESAMLDYFVQQDCNLTQIGGLLDSKVSQNLGLGLGFSLGEMWSWYCAGLGFVIL